MPKTTKDEPPPPEDEEALLDEALEESFPASDPAAPAVPSREDPADRR